LNFNNILIDEHKAIKLLLDKSKLTELCIKRINDKKEIKIKFYNQYSRYHSIEFFENKVNVCFINGKNKKIFIPLIIEEILIEGQSWKFYLDYLKNKNSFYLKYLFDLKSKYSIVMSFKMEKGIIHEKTKKCAICYIELKTLNTSYDKLYCKDCIKQVNLEKRVNMIYINRDSDIHPNSSLCKILKTHKDEFHDDPERLTTGDMMRIIYGDEDE
jgi:hypothetical protein